MTKRVLALLLAACMLLPALTACGGDKPPENNTPQVSEDQMVILARELAKRIENELEYPGQIKVHVLRETKVVEYAK